MPSFKLLALAAAMAALGVRADYVSVTYYSDTACATQSNVGFQLNGCIITSLATSKSLSCATGAVTNYAGATCTGTAASTCEPCLLTSDPPSSAHAN